MTPQEAYYITDNHTKSDFNFAYYQEIACKESMYAYYVAQDVPGANIEYCQEHACKNSYYAYLFAKNIPGANIEYCRKACGSSSYWLNEFNIMIIEKALS